MQSFVILGEGLHIFLRCIYPFRIIWEPFCKKKNEYESHTWRPLNENLKFRAKLEFLIFVLKKIVKLNGDLHCKQAFMNFWPDAILRYLVMIQIFQVFVVIIMLNLLISLMTTTFARIQRNADIEWKFTRASTWIHYFDDSDAVPVPFNLVPSPYNLLAFFRWLRNWIPCKKNRLSARKSTSLGQTYIAKRLM